MITIYYTIDCTRLEKNELDSVYLWSDGHLYCSSLWEACIVCNFNVIGLWRCPHCNPFRLYGHSIPILIVEGFIQVDL